MAAANRKGTDGEKVPLPSIRDHRKVFSLADFRLSSAGGRKNFVSERILSLRRIFFKLLSRLPILLKKHGG